MHALQGRVSLSVIIWRTLLVLTLILCPYVKFVNLKTKGQLANHHNNYQHFKKKMNAHFYFSD